MARRKRKKLTADAIIHRLMTDFYASRFCMMPDEIRTIEIYLKTGFMDDKAVAKKLREFGFNVEKNTER